MFASFLDFCHVNHTELAKHFQQYNGSVVLRGDNVKDDTGYRAVFASLSGGSSNISGYNLFTSRYGRRSKRRCLVAPTSGMSETPRLL